jgi:cell division protein FtsB
MLYVWRESRALYGIEKELFEVNLRNKELRRQQEEILTNPKALERFARERYFMSRPTEEVYRIVND